MKTRIAWLLGSAAVLLLVAGVFAQDKTACPSCSAGKAKNVAAVKKACPTCKDGEACAACAAKKVAADGKKKPEEVKWLTDFAKARATAKKQKRNIMVNFSGSDWCYWCKRLDGEVLSQKAFKDYARGRLVLFNADFPRAAKQSDKVKAQNDKLQKKYGIRGFPTVLLLNPEGKVLVQTGYQKGGPEAYVKHLNKILEDAKKREEAAKKTEEKTKIRAKITP